MEDKKTLLASVRKELEENGYIIVDDKLEIPEETKKQMAIMNFYSSLAVMDDPYVLDVGDKPLSKADRNAKVVDVRTEPKIRRNDPCNCGSGIKYKKCCGFYN